jgi:hypothetical protein
MTGCPARPGAQLVEPPQRQIASPTPPRYLLRSPALQGVTALALYLLVWPLTSARALIEHPGWSMLDQKSMDPNFYVWCLCWWPYSIGHALNPCSTLTMNRSGSESSGG